MKIALMAWMGATHFLTKQLKNVSAEISLHVLAYNMTGHGYNGYSSDDGGNKGIKAPY
jgi:hypothetical protein